MGRYRHEIDNVRSHVRSLWIVIALLSLIIAGLGVGWGQAPRRITVHLPPDLRAGADLAIDTVPPANVYAFAYYIFQQLNRWPDDGAQDCGRAIRSKCRGPRSGHVPRHTLCREPLVPRARDS